ncbi:MAG: xanthine dehydrogenase family protein molybdopterin-binding subunit, partial [Acidimicrobiia bacterium]
MTAVVGTRQLRREDAALLTGEAKFVDDLAVPGALHVKLLRSTVAHARIVSIDTGAAASMPGVVAVYTGADLRDEWANPLPCAWPVTDDMKNPAHWPIAVEEVGYAGDAVAVVVAETKQAARDALESIVVEYDALPAVLDLEDAAADTNLVHAELGTNESYTWSLIPDPAAVDAAFANATHVVSERYLQQRLIPMAMEPRGVVVQPEPFGGNVTVYSSTQIPHILKVM